MTTLKELTDEEFRNLLDEYYAEPKRRQKLTQQEAQSIAQRLNKKIHVPIINETREGKILLKIVLKVDNFLYDNMPNEFYDLVRSIDKGIDDDEAKRLIKSLSRLANRKIDIPYIPENMEYMAIRMILGVVINAARKEWDIHKSQSMALNLDLPDSLNPTDEQLEAIVVTV